MGVDVAMDDDEGEEGQRSAPVHQKRVHCSLSSLCDWYSSVTKVSMFFFFSSLIHVLHI